MCAAHVERAQAIAGEAGVGEPPAQQCERVRCGRALLEVVEVLDENDAPAGAEHARRLLHRGRWAFGPGQYAVDHHGVEAAYVIQGASVRAPGKPAQTLATGATARNLRDVPHAGFTVEGPDSLKLFTVHVVDQGRPLYVYAR